MVKNIVFDYGWTLRRYVFGLFVEFFLSETTLNYRHVKERERATCKCTLKLNHCLEWYKWVSTNW